MKTLLSPRRRQLFPSAAASALTGLLMLGAGSVMAQAQAQTAAPPPTQGATGPIRLIVPFTPGTGIDLIARTVGPKLSERLGRPVVVDNRPGASGNTGTEAVVRAAPDGSTLLVSVNTLVMNRSLYPTLSWDPVRDLTPITLTSWGQLLLVAHPKTGWRTARELLDAARKQPGRLNYASPGVGTPHHLSMELLKNTTGTFITHIPYRGTGPAVTDLLGGHVQFTFATPISSQAHIKDGKLRAMAVLLPARSALFPTVPTAAEA